MSIRYLYKQIKEKLFKGRAIVILGPRRVGKTTLMKEILKSYNLEDIKYVSGDELDIREKLSFHSLTSLKSFVSGKKILAIDEAQMIPNIGLTVKLIVDNIENVQIIMTGSSALELRSEISEPMTGRAYIFNMYPLSVSEIKEEQKLENYQLDTKLNELMIYGNYPEVSNANISEKREYLENLRSSYLFKDALSFNGIKKPDLIVNLATALAYQVGSEVNYNELSDRLKVDNETVQRYLRLLEDTFVTFRINPYFGDPRKNIGKIKSRKIYFFDNGVMNSLKGDFNSLSVRDDIGALFENFMISERIKRNELFQERPLKYFWRNRGSEVDYIEESDGKTYGFEFKANNKSPEFSPTYVKQFGNLNKTVNLTNWKDFILD